MSFSKDNVPDRLDTVHQHVTPEGAVLRLRSAGAPVRGLAWALDLLIRIGIFVLISLLFSVFGKLGMGFYLIALFLLEWFYNVVFEVWRGATPGKKALGLQVVMENGTPLTWSASLLRNLLRVVDFLPLLYCFGFIWSLFHRQSQRLGDIAAGTLVVYQDQAPVLAESKDTPKAVALPVTLDYVTQQAIMNFAERAPKLSQQRQIELAEMFEPLHHQHGEAAVKMLLSYAQGIAGRS